MEYNVTAGKFGTFYVNPGPKGNGLQENDSASLTNFTTIYTDHCPVMQFTGLQDKNGKEIYERDILEALHPGYLNESGKKIVYWREEDACYYLKPVDASGFLPISFFEEVEVIGNIYENPELLK